MVRARMDEQAIRAAVGVPGDGDLVVEGVAVLETAEDGLLYWLDDAGAKRVVQTHANVRDCIFIAPEGSGVGAALPRSRVLEVRDSRAAISRVLEMIRAEGLQPPLLSSTSIAPTAAVAPSSVVEGHVDIAGDVQIGALCTVGPDVVIGAGTIVLSGARLLRRTVIGERCCIGPNAVIGYAGHGFVRDADGGLVRIPPLAGVVIGSDVEVGALAIVEAGTITPTLIEDGAKVGSLVLVGHNARLGRGANLTGSQVVGGSATVGEDAWVGVNASIRNGRSVGARTLVGMDASVQDDLPDDSVARGPNADVAPRPDDDDYSAVGFRRPGETK